MSFIISPLVKLLQVIISGLISFPNSLTHTHTIHTCAHADSALETLKRRGITPLRHRTIRIFEIFSKIFILNFYSRAFRKNSQSGRKWSVLAINNDLFPCSTTACFIYFSGTSAFQTSHFRALCIFHYFPLPTPQPHLAKWFRYLNSSQLSTRYKARLEIFFYVAVTRHKR